MANLRSASKKKQEAAELEKTNVEHTHIHRRRRRSGVPAQFAQTVGLLHDS